MIKDAEISASLDRVDLDAWELRTNTGTMRLTMEPDGPFKRVMLMPQTRQNRHQVAAQTWAMQCIIAELEGDGLAVRFIPGMKA